MFMVVDENRKVWLNPTLDYAMVRQVVTALVKGLEKPFYLMYGCNTISKFSFKDGAVNEDIGHHTLPSDPQYTITDSTGKLVATCTSYAEAKKFVIHYLRNHTISYQKLDVFAAGILNESFWMPVWVEEFRLMGKCPMFSQKPGGDKELVEEV